MPKIFVTTRDGTEHELDAASGVSLMENIRDGGIDELMALCSGGCSCATCQVYIDEALPGGLTEISQDENELLDSSTYRKNTSRLSCQVIMNDGLSGLRVTISPED
ncbi:2Fe-2S iron-sulfur cluster-binding protein [Paraburkholderia sp. J63]|uniref:2Fe-2S iron-sulfur cluster-binding protein n=1 Tax=Paraburkholderia sp. J63 TaxID=2805434 RepID=UPI002ABE3EA7|nr:2Fe-2S iron-sulfur cluster-binding protein [Paraburkholderia sp. J63]